MIYKMYGKINLSPFWPITLDIVSKGFMSIGSCIRAQFPYIRIDQAFRTLKTGHK